VNGWANGSPELVAFASEHGVRLVLEPLHPMYAADRAVLSTLKQALDLCSAVPLVDCRCGRRKAAWRAGEPPTARVLKQE
jgi:hypothetical protein